MKMQIKRVISAGLFSLGLVSAADAAMVVSDHFDDGNLDPAWQVSLANASGWTGNEAGTNLTVTDINSTLIDSWATVTLSQSFSGLSDFQADFDFSWDSEGSVNAMQRVWVSLLDTQGDKIAFAGFNDAWVDFSGEQIANITGDGTFQSGKGSLSLSGSASIDITRVGSSIDILWGGVNILSGTNSDVIARVELEYAYFKHTATGTSFFANESIDLVNVAGTSAVPVPAAVWLFGSGLMGLIGIARRKQAT